MEASLSAFEVSGTVDEKRQLYLDQNLPISGPIHVRVIALYPVDDEISKEEWLYATSQNPAFQPLHEAAEDIHTLDDGKPFRDKD